MSESLYCAQVIGGPIAATLLLLDGKAGLYGWQWLFILVGCPTVLFGGLIKVGQNQSTIAQNATTISPNYLVKATL